MMMAFEDEGSATVKREWVAVTDTSIKASPALASTLETHEKMPVVKGTHVTATITGEDREYWTISSGVVDDVPVQESLRFLYKDHWDLQPEPVAPAAVEAEEPPPQAATAALAAETVAQPTQPEPVESVAKAPVNKSPKPASNRRLSALFKRRPNSKQD